MMRRFAFDVMKTDDTPRDDINPSVEHVEGAWTLSQSSDQQQCGVKSMPEKRRAPHFENEG
jgi:hypothetical protein